MDQDRPAPSPSPVVPQAVRTGGMGWGRSLGLTPLDASRASHFSADESVEEWSPSSLGSQQRGIDIDHETITTAGVIPESQAAVTGAPVTRISELPDLHRASQEILQRRLGRDYVSGHLFHLSRDYAAAQVIVHEAKSRPHSAGRYRINYDFLAEDPFLPRHSQDIHQLYPDPVNEQEWLEIRNALKSYPEVADLGQGLDRVFMVAAAYPHLSPRSQENRGVIRKRVKRLFDLARQQEASGAPGLSAASPGGDLSLRLYGNLDRCIDGLHSGLSDLEKVHFAEGESESAGDLISRVFTDYKMDFIEKHGDLKPYSSEFKTTVVQNLRQRMLYSLGLRGVEAEVAHPVLGDPESSELKPKRVMARFLAGERAQLPHEVAVVEFEAFNVDKMVKLLQQSRERGLMNLPGNRPLHPEVAGIKLKSAFIQQISLADPILADAYIEFFTDPHAPNDYFVPAPVGEFSGNIRLKDRFWLHLLEANGYIQRP